mmetsp:Transcript_35004/g.99216  ORF Transcript_35004/g.99216 Transcript_35004/m.99216 type:complete len:688 (-) Transcript_35004:130-2193(-)|eukprot:CAMPEP_0117677750 /NCGR_PEP_ID=MMETSP0804-20121206/16910_1 /TAXON_ID=1074897 /ORGANISM="Tetraselmis astigmatica, Strain CCMP880" /LENGTH=687 /DNA_ID=CAMNT_0005487051 /DNA_START=126 /DNA_END=2189 /DNA_ORIENTATION=+
MEEQRVNQERQERINARRSRIQERLAQMRLGDEDGPREEKGKEEITKGKQQIIESRRRLLRMKAKSDAEVTSVSISGDDRENQRRIAEEQRRQELRSKLLSEAESSARQNAAVAMRWADLFSIEVPQDLHGEIEKQRRSCAKIVQSKNELISEIKSELKGKDDEYVRVLKKQAEDIDVILHFMTAQFHEMKEAFQEELNEIENAFLQERTELLAANKIEMKNLFDKRSSMEQNFMEATQERAETYHKALEDLRVADAEEYNILKIRLETDIQNLEQYLEAMRATYQLNTEKLEYNYRVLVERDHENQSTINQQKRKIARQRDILSGLKDRYAETDKRFQEENQKLTEEYKRITEQFKFLQGKFRHFELSDIKKYHDIWNMKEKSVAELVKEVLQADKIIHEQQLGWDWRPPSEEVFLSPHDALAEANGTAGDEDPGEDDDSEAAEQAAKDVVAERTRDPRYFGALQLLVDEAGFLVDVKANKMLDALPKDELGRVRVDSILRALGVTDGASFDALMDALSATSKTYSKSKGVEGQKLGDDDPLGSSKATAAEALDDAPLLVAVHPDEAVKRLKLFIEHETPNHGGGKGAQKQMAGASRVAGVSRRVQEREKEYWVRMSNVVSEKMVRIWNALDKNLQGYHKLLEGREDGLQVVESLRTQNQELRTLLNQYLSSSINEELQVPPTVLI